MEEAAIEAKEREGVRRRRRRTFTLPKRFPIPVRALWDSATEAERLKAHQTGTAILEMWLGQASRKEVSDRLQIPTLRVWQLSQQALSGLVAGLLKQPKRRLKKGEGRAWEESPWKLKARIAKLTQEVERLQTLVGLLRELPAHRTKSPRKEVPRVPSKRRANPKGAPSRTKSHRTTIAATKSPSRGTTNRGQGPRGHGADVKKLDKSIKETAVPRRSPKAQPTNAVSSVTGCGAGVQKTKGRVAADRQSITGKNPDPVGAGDAVPDQEA